jgi:8-oxo-dGTP diphosphatase
MRLIRRITDSDFVGGDPEWLTSVSRYGSRGVLVDSMSHVAMMYMSEPHLYKLPGGGIEKDEKPTDAFVREIKEETGFEAEVIHELGYIEEHKISNKFMQYSYCFVAKATTKRGEVTLSDQEKKLGMIVMWMSIDQALEVMNEAMYLAFLPITITNSAS